MYSRSGVPIKKSHEITKNTIREDEFQVIPELQVEDEPYVSRNRFAFVTAKSTQNTDQKFSFSPSPKDSTLPTSTPSLRMTPNDDTNNSKYR